MNREVLTRRLGWVSLVCGGLLLVLETLFGILYGDSLQGMAIDWLAGILLLYSGYRALALHVAAPALLFGAWCFALCDIYRALMWRAEHYFGNRPVEGVSEPFGLFVFLVGVALMTVACFCLSLYLVHPKVKKKNE